MERRALLQLGAGLTAAVGLGAVGGVVGERYWIELNHSGYAVTTGQMAGLGTTLMVWRGSKNQPLAALTFDDGPTPGYTPGVLKALSDADASATFFMMGKHVVAYPDLARQVAGRHEIGNHSYTHPDMSRATDSMARDQLGRTHDAIGRITKKTPTLFRPPYGRFSGAVERVAAELGYSTILWSDRFHPDSTAADNVVRLGKAIDPGFIVLFHDGFNPNNKKIIEALPALIKRVRDRGIRLVGVTELLTVMLHERAAASMGKA